MRKYRERGSASLGRRGSGVVGYSSGMETGMRNYNATTKSQAEDCKKQCKSSATASGG
jgi:hypothetical protein